MLYIYNLMFEAGRDCNMRCPHCLRGEPQKKSMKLKIVEKVLEDIDIISCLTITGGEPFLYPRVIGKITDEIVNRGITLDYFFMFSNGTLCTPRAVSSLKKLYEISEDRGACSLTFSRDEFHERPNFDAIDQWILELGEDVVNMRGEIGESRLLLEGRAEENGYDTLRKPSVDTPQIRRDGDDILVEDGMVYINADGDVIFGCDFSYENQPKYKVGNVLEKPLKEILLSAGEFVN